MTLQYELLTEPIFWQISALVAVLGGIAYIVVGVRMSRPATPSRRQTALLLRRVSGLVRGEGSHVYSTDDLHAVQRQWRGQMRIACIGTGVGVLFGVLVSVALAQLALHAPFSLPFALFWLLYLPPFWGIPFGVTCGSIIAARQQASSRRLDAIVAGPPISHKVLDYRSPLLPLIVTFPAIVYTILTILMAPKYTPFFLSDIREYFDIYGRELVSPPSWILAIYPCALWLTVLLVECCVWVRVKTPASITSPDLQLARGTNMALIGRNLAFIYTPMMVSPVQMMGLGVMMLLTHTTHDLNVILLIFATYGSTLLVGSMSMIVVTPSEGRLGGRLTGWVWSNRAAQEGGAAAAGEGGVV